MLFHQDADVINKITEIRKVQFNNSEVYFCDVDLGGKGRLPLDITDLFLFPFKAKTDDPACLVAPLSSGILNSGFVIEPLHG